MFFFFAFSVILNEVFLIPVNVFPLCAYWPYAPTGTKRNDDDDETPSPEDSFCAFRKFLNWILEFSLFRKYVLESLHHKENNKISDLHALILF